jgi:hypothetical protein
MPRRAAEIDTDSFSELVDEAVQAFGEDIIYAVSMLKASATIRRKRVIWRAKKDLREAEKQAVELCSKAGTFVCSNRTPCGTGSGCKFAEGDLTLITTESVKGSSKRPQEWSADSYNIEDAFEDLLKIRSKNSR